MKRCLLDVAMKKRVREFLVLQSFPSTLVYFLCKIVISPWASSTTLLAAVNALALFQLPLLIFSVSLIKTYTYPFRGGSPRFVLLLACYGVSCCISVVCLYGCQPFGALGLRSFLAGLIYGLRQRKCELEFPVVQRPFYFSYRPGVVKSVKKALKLSSDGSLGSLVLTVFIYPPEGELAMRDVIIEHIVFFSACAVVFICWELNRHLLELCLTSRLLFVPPKGSSSSAAEEEEETDLTHHLLIPLENTTSTEHARYLAYVDLCMVSETNFETLRRAAIFEETYKRVMGVCLKPLQQLTQDLSNRLSLLSQPFKEFQVFAWCARIASSLTVRSRSEDGLGIARLSGSNAAVVSTLLAALLAVEDFMGASSFKEEHYSKAYSMADILKTSVTQIVWNFHEEMVASSRNGLLDRDWITSGNGKRELLVQKLQMFLEFQAN